MSQVTDFKANEIPEASVLALDDEKSDECIPIALHSDDVPVKKTNIKRSESSKSTKSKHKSTNPYDQISSCYSHEATTVPPYVLYGIANSETEQGIKKTNGSSVPGQIENTLQDPFLSALNNNWGTFFKTVDNTPAYSEGILNNDLEAFNQLPDLSGKWGGDARLKSFLNNDHTDLQEYMKKALHHQQSHTPTSSASSYNRDYTKSRSKAGYWMSTAKREEWIPYFRRILISNNYLPLFFRLLTIALSAIALAISTHIYKLSDTSINDPGTGDILEIPQQASTVMAICVQSVALVYLFYITYDEFYSKPIGIRNPVEKIRLILLDLLFIIFSSANLTLSFHSIKDSTCSTDIDALVPTVSVICRNQKALVAFLFVILTMWVVTFTISILRVIQKVSGPSP